MQWPRMAVSSCLKLASLVNLRTMKFLKSSLWLCIAAVSIAPVHAQQTLTPEQQKQAAEALRKALEQEAPAAPAKPATPAKPTTPAPAEDVKPGAAPAAAVPATVAPAESKAA